MTNRRQELVKSLSELHNSLENTYLDWNGRVNDIINKSIQLRDSMPGYYESIQRMIQRCEQLAEDVASEYDHAAVESYIGDIRVQMTEIEAHLTNITDALP